MGGIIDKVANIGQTSDADRARTAAKLASQGAQKAAQAREAELKKAVEFGQQGLTASRGAGQSALDQLNSPEQLRAFNEALGQQETALKRQAQLFDSLDPAILEASQQALQLLQGEDAKALAPLRTNRARQRQALVDRLREQLGPGAETSTAGMQALNQFDQQTSEVLTGAQQQGLSQLFGIGQAGAQGRSALNQGAQSLAGIGNQRGALMAQTQLGAGGLEQQGFGQLINAQGGLASGAGSQFVGQQLQGQFGMQAAQQSQNQNTQIFGTLIGAGADAAKAAMGAPTG